MDLLTSFNTATDLIKRFGHVHAASHASLMLDAAHDADDAQSALDWTLVLSAIDGRSRDLKRFGWDGKTPLS